MSKRGAHFDKIFAEAVADRLGDGRKLFLKGLLHLDLLPKPLDTLLQQAEGYSPEITLPALQLFRQPGFYTNLDGFFRKFCVRMLREHFLPKVKVGEGIGQARKLIAWAAHAIENDDQKLYPQIIGLLDQARQNTKDPNSYHAVATSLIILGYFVDDRQVSESTLCYSLCGYVTTPHSGPILADLLREATR